MSNNLVEGFLIIPVSSNENFFWAFALYSSTDLKPCFMAMAGDSLEHFSQLNLQNP